MTEPGQPCTFCGVRPDVACRHRPADSSYRPPDQSDSDGRARKLSETKRQNSGTNGSRSFVLDGKTVFIKGS